ncbi:MAG: hypothetical protein CYPHOPRED_000460 [Cyphobasidiales sp. Tagirdzhanova-0007]|nr:MAG: hypothetical protein CYPHOPRED_000460 [Cyphobasidiales sp. Tagirdzhanova-0007]
MFMFRSLIDKVTGGSNAKAELANLDGCFYLVRPSVTVRGAKECLFQTAIASVRRTSQPFQYELVVNRSVTQEEAQLLEDDTETMDEYVSLIDARMNFTVAPASEIDSDRSGAVAFTWLDLAGEDEDSYLFVVEGVVKEEIVTFEQIMYRCMWERENNRDFKDGSNLSELEGYKINSQPASPAAPSKVSPPKKKAPLFRPPSPSSSDDEVADELTSQVSKLKLGSVDTSGPAMFPVTSSTTTASSKGKGRALTSTSPSVTSKPSSAKASPAPAKAQMREPSAEPAPIPPTIREPEPESAATPSQSEIANAAYDPPDGRKLMLSEECDINLFDKATAMFMLQEASVLSTLWLVSGHAYTCWLSVAGKDGFIWISTPVDGQLPLHFEEGHFSIIISFNNEKTGQNYTWLLRYPNQEVYSKMNAAFTQGVFEASNGLGTWAKLKPVEQRYNREAYTDDVEMTEAEPYIPEEDVEEGQPPQEEFEEELYSDEGEATAETSETESEEEPSRGKAKNSLLAVGYKGMSFVVRGDMIGVFENQKGSGKKLKFMTNISGIGRPGSKNTFTPGKVMLHDQDMTMILSDPLNPKSLYRLDLTTGKVTDEYKVSENLDINNFLPDSKYAQTTQQQTFIGTSHNALFRIDPRLSGSKLVDSEYKQYVSKNDFSAATTTDSGNIAVASNKGEIRLFDSIGKNAKTALPGLGHPIIGVDVTADGRYVVATTKTYLLFIDTKITEGRYAGQSGFERSFPADARPTPRCLTLKQEHLAYIGGQPNLNFTPAKFNTGVGDLEKTIVTSTGPFVVAFNFRAVKAGRLREYKIKRYDETIVADNFRFGDDREIVVTLPNDLRMEAKSQLQTPSRQSLAPSAPRPSGIRRSNIVKQWEE